MKKKKEKTNKLLPIQIKKDSLDKHQKEEKNINLRQF